MTTNYFLFIHSLPIFLLGLMLLPTGTTARPKIPELAFTIDCSRTNDPYYVGGEGDAIIGVSGGTPPYSVTWSGPANGTGTLVADGDFRINSLPSGEYAIIVQDLDGVVETCSFTLSEYECDLDLEFIGVPPACAGSATGAFVVLFNSQSFNTITWEWSDEGNSTFKPFWAASFGTTGLSAGTYAATITDYFGCTESDTLTLVDPPALEVNCSEVIHPSSALAKDGSLQPDIFGGQLPYHITLSGPVTIDTLLENPTNFEIPNLPIGIYELFVMDDNGCAGYCSVILGQSPECAMQVRLTPTPVGCQGETTGSIQVDVIGGNPNYTFDWSIDQYDDQGTNGTITDLPAGEYELTVTDANGCQAYANTTVIEPAPFSITCGQVNFPTEPDSLNGSFAVTMGAGAPDGPYTIYIDDHQGFRDTVSGPVLDLNDYTYNGVTDHIYSITVVSKAGCTASCAVDMSIPLCERNFLRTTQQLGVSCDGESDGTLLLEIVNGNADNYSFSWNHPMYDGQDSLYNLPAGIYRVTATSPTGCINIAGFAVLAPPPLILMCTDTISPSAAGMADGSNLLTIIGGTLPYTVSWDGPVAGGEPVVFQERYEITGLPAGNYTVSIRDSKGCTADCAFFITDPSANCTPALVLLENTLCYKDSVQVGEQYFHSARPNGEVIFPGGARNGCDSIVQVALQFPEPVETLVQETLCWGESRNIGNEIFDRDRPSGTVVMTGADGCDSTIQVELHFLPEQVANLYGDTTLCKPKDSLLLQLEVTGQMDYSYLIRNSFGQVINNFGADETMVSVFPIQSESYTLEQVNTGNNCPVTLQKNTVHITVSDPRLNFQTGDYSSWPISCSGAHDGAITVEVENAIFPLSYEWSNGQITSEIEGLGAGTYWLTVTDKLGCNGEDSITLSEPLPILTIARGQAPGCQGNDAARIWIEDIDGGTGLYTYSINESLFSPISEFPFEVSTVDGPGVYSLLVQDENGCSWSDTVRVPTSQVLSLDLGPDLELEWGDSLQLVPQLNFIPSTWFWMPSIDQPENLSLSPFVSPQKTTRYIFTATDENGCTISDELQVFVNTTIDVFIPNAFSPDGNGTNDRLSVFAGPEVRSIVYFEVYDRWGNQLFTRQDFSPNDTTIGWDGTFHGQPVNSGMYFYSTEVSLIDGRRTTLSGVIHLIR